MSRFVGIEIGGTKLQFALGDGLGSPFDALVRRTVQLPGQAPQIQLQIIEALAELRTRVDYDWERVRGIGIGFGGPVDSGKGIITRSHQVAGWNEFPMVEWLRQETGLPVVLQNDADSAAFAESCFGAGRGFDPLMYVTVGSGIGGGLILNGRVYRGQGAGAMEIGHLRPGVLPKNVPLPATTVESVASGFGITERARRIVGDPPHMRTIQAPHPTRLLELSRGDTKAINTQMIAEAARLGDRLCQALLGDATEVLGWALAQAIMLLNPARIVIGGGVSLIGENDFFSPLRRACRRNSFTPFVDLAQIVPAALQEEVVVHGALALARAEFGTDATPEG